MSLLKKHWKILLSVWIAFVFIQSMFFKFSGAYETVHIFSTLGEWSGFDWFSKYGAYMVGGTELLAAIVLFTPWRVWGALLSFGVMSGAIFFHLFTPLGIAMPAFDETGNVIGDDAGTLFIMACLTWLASLALIWSEKAKLGLVFSSNE